MPRNLPGGFVFNAKYPGICQEALYSIQHRLADSGWFCIEYNGATKIPPAYIYNLSVPNPRNYYTFGALVIIKILH
jgi:hypothetical protein